MITEKLDVIYEKLNKLGPNTKSIIIIILTIMCVIFSTKNLTLQALQEYHSQQVEDKMLAEEYTRVIAPYVNDYCQKILDLDTNASNVILLNYHNTLVSTNGLSYRYLTSISEKRRGLETKSCIKIWKELDYINYGEELESINRNNYLTINDINRYKQTIPNLCELLSLCDAKSAAFYPIRGIDSWVGMIIVLYPENKIYPDTYYRSVIMPIIQPLAVLLDYNEMQDKFKYLYKNKDLSLTKLLQK